MENKLGMVGMGRIQNGVMVFADATGKGFAKKVSRPAEVKPEVQPVVYREPAVKQGVSMIKEDVVDVPDFMKHRRPVVVEEVVEPVNKVTYLNNGYQGESKRSLRSDAKKVWNWLWDLED